MTLFNTETPVASTAHQVPVAGQGRTGDCGEAVAHPVRPAHRVVGVDLSLTRTGVASCDAAVSIESTGRKDATLPQRQQRLRHLRQLVIAACERGGEPDLIVIEGPSYSSKNAASQHDRSGLWWLLIDAFTIRGWRAIEVAPSTRMKYATGKGMVSKDVVLASAIKRLSIDVTNNDEADAAWLCALGHELLGSPIVDLPQDHRAALVAVRARTGDLA
jgi:crossover junction endodeoxyribonuclease RuvC